MEQFADWAPELQALITEADGAPVPRTINALPIGHHWQRVPGGDAAGRRRACDVAVCR
jgi:hypothetical protein